MAPQSLPSFLLPTTRVKIAASRRPTLSVKNGDTELRAEWPEQGERREDVFTRREAIPPFDLPDEGPKPLQMDTTAGQAGGAPVVSGQKIVANATMIGQQQSNWCWAAVAQSVRGWASSPAAQQDIATAHVQASGRPYTCAPPNASTTAGGSCAPNHQCQGSCNDQHILSVVLAENGRLQGQAQQLTPTFGQMIALLNLDKPVPCRVRWSAQAGHFIMVIGWTVDAGGVQKVHVLDPATAPAGSPVSARIWSFSDFVSQYSISGPTGTINFIYEVQ